MKKKVLKLSLILLSFEFTTAGCQKDEIIDVRYPFKLQYAIHNEERQEVTRIKEGENFYIYFSIENTSDRHASIDKHELFFNNELFNIYDRNNNTIVGNPVERNVCLAKMGCLGQPHVKNEITIPYPLKNDTTVGFMCCSYKLYKFPELPQGKYFIKYTASIPFFYITDTHQVESHETGNYNLEYKFEIVK